MNIAWREEKCSWLDLLGTETFVLENLDRGRQKRKAEKGLPRHNVYVNMKISQNMAMSESRYQTIQERREESRSVSSNAGGNPVKQG